MQNTKLIQLLRSMNPAEFREFKDYVISPVFNKNKKIIVLFDSIKKYYPEFENDSISEENIFKKIFQDEEYDYFKVKNIVSDLYSLGKDYLAFIHYRDVSEVKEKFLLEQLRDRSLDNIFEISYKVFKKKLDNSPVKDENYILKCLELTEELHSFQIPKDPGTRLDFFQIELDYFLKYSIIRLLRFYNIMLHDKIQNNVNFDMKMYEEIMSYLKINKNEDNPTLLIYYNIILLGTERDEKYFFKLKELKDRYFEALNNGDRYMLFLHMANFCAYIYNNLGRTDFMYEHFLLSKENYDRGTIILGKVLYPDFLNHVKIAVRVEEFEWALNYIQKYKHLLTEEKESTLNFCNGIIHYKKGDLDKALDLLSKANFPDFIIKIQVKILLLQIYFEKEYYEQAFSMIDAFRHYLQREKSIPEHSKGSFYDFLRNTNDLIKIKTSIGSEDKKFELKKISENTENMEFNQFGIKNWLKNKVAELA